MNSKHSRSRWRNIRTVLGICFVLQFVSGVDILLAQESSGAPPPAATAPAATPDTTAAAPAPKIPPEQLESLVAPIALYPDALLAQTLVASTYPLEIVQLQQWMTKHKDLKDKALADSVAKQDWDPSIQSMAAIPEVVERLANDIQWTTDLGNAFLAQQADVMDAVQRMRKKAEDKGALASNEQQKVETKVVEKDTVIVVVSTNPEVVYVPSYSPAVVYGPPVYPYPPIYYPYYPPGAAFVSFSMGVMWGAAWGGSCCGCGWGGGGNNIYINNNNNFNQINHHGGDRGGNRGGDRGGNSTWQHDAKHRGAAPYGDKATANKYGGSTRGDRQASASNRPSAGTSNRAGQGSAGASNRAGQGSAGASNRAGQGSAGAGNRAGPGSSAGAPSAANRGGGSASRGGDQIGNRNIPPSSSSRNSGGFSGGSRGYSGSSARASSSRGSMSRGGGGRGGGRR